MLGLWTAGTPITTIDEALIFTYPYTEATTGISEYSSDPNRQTVYGCYFEEILSVVHQRLLILGLHKLRRDGYSPKKNRHIPQLSGIHSLQLMPLIHFQLLVLYWAQIDAEISYSMVVSQRSQEVFKMRIKKPTGLMPLLQAI